ncbi:unnamed protein product [Bursaphelenchus okinawaensis]|uniref:C3H1-type domain-containing protein n=1 Tax=Bursaphelenchus okinawaensis TaxID=465554 RepID=A0A811LLI8_9BILA|nr:unnamed protein product [Bursaphelenchus okinawaensis]CAG9125376.1 unnamed protein product [Bursaphelenchus okinawaensis]
MFNNYYYGGGQDHYYAPTTSYYPANSNYYNQNEYEPITYQQPFLNPEQNPFHTDFTYKLPVSLADHGLVDEEEEVDMTDEEIAAHKAKYPYNPYEKLLEKKGGPNRLIKVLFNAQITAKDKPVGCSQPQKADGSFNPEVLPVIEKMLNNELESQKEIRPKYKLIDPGEYDAVGSSRGYIINNGNTWVRRKEPEAQAFVPSPPKRFGNKSLVIVGGKKITNESNECIAFAKNKTCPASNMCIYNHDGDSGHLTKRFCSSQMKGMCRNDKTCDQGYHLLTENQLPVCHYYFKMSCSEEECPYLHVKHSDRTDTCPDFQKGVCQLGIQCNYIHRYSSSVIAQKTDVALEFSRIEEELPPLATWFL